MSKERLEEIVQVFDDVVSTGNGTFNDLGWPENIGLLIDAVRELQAEKETLSMAHDNIHKELQQYKAAYMNLSNSLASVTKANEKLTKSNTSLVQQNEHLTNLLYPDLEKIRVEISD